LDILAYFRVFSAESGSTLDIVPKTILDKFAGIGKASGAKF